MRGARLLTLWTGRFGLLCLRLLLSRLLLRLRLGRIPTRVTPRLPRLSRPIEAPPHRGRLHLRRWQRLTGHMVLPSSYRIIERLGRRWWDLSGHRRTPTRVSLWWLLLLLLLERRDGSLRKLLALWTWELGVQRGRLWWEAEEAP